MASDPLPFNLHDQLEPLECNSRQTRRGSASPQSAHTSSCNDDDDDDEFHNVACPVVSLRRRSAADLKQGGFRMLQATA